MCVATSTIIAVSVAGASVASQQIAAKKQRDAAKDAAATQTAAGDKALAAQQTAYQTQRQDFSPYQQAGQGALGRLNQRAGQQAPTFNPNGPQASLGNPMGGQMPPQQPQQPPGGQMGTPGMPQGGPPPQAPQGPPPTQQQQLGQQQAPRMVLMQGPDGSKRPVLKQMLTDAQARGRCVRIRCRCSFRRARWSLADWFDETGPQIDPQWGTGGYGGGLASTGQGMDNGGLQLSAPTGGGQQQPPQAGQFANTQQGFLDWATQKYGVDPTRGAGFVNAQAGGGLQNMLQQYSQATGNTAQYQGGPSGDRVNFGQGTTDAITSGGQIWNPQGGGGGGQQGGGPSFGGGYGGGGQLSGLYGGGGGGNATLPTAPGVKDLTAPAPFTYQPSNLGSFQGPGAYQAPAPFKASSQVPTAQQTTYNPMQAPSRLTPQLFGQPQQQQIGGQQTGGVRTASLGAPAGGMQTGGFRPSDGGAGGLSSTGQGMDESAPNIAPAAGGLSSTGQGMDESGGQLFGGGQGGGNQAPGGANPDGAGQSNLGMPQVSYQNQGAAPTLNYEKYTGAPGAQDAYKFRFGQGLEANQNTLAHSGALRTGAAAKALTDYGQGMASQEFAAEDARQRANTSMNNQNAFNFGNANFQNQFQVGAANNAGNMAAQQGNITNQFNATNANNAANLAYGTQNFNQEFAANQANNQGQFQTTQANNQNAFNQQGAQYGQDAGTYGMNAQLGMGAQNQNFNQALAGYGANQAANQQQYNQAFGAYGQNAQTQFQYGAQNQNNALANYQAQVNAALGQGNLNLGYQNSNNNYALGQGNLALNQQGQNFNQNLATWQQNYQSQVLDPWQQNYQLASLGNPGQPNTQGYGNQLSDIYQGQGNANAASQIAQGNATANAWSNLGNIAAGAGNYYQQQQQKKQGLYY